MTTEPYIPVPPPQDESDREWEPMQRVCPTCHGPLRRRGADWACDQHSVVRPDYVPRIRSDNDEEEVDNDD